MKEWIEGKPRTIVTPPAIINERTVRYKSNVRIHPFCNIWGTPDIGENVQIGAFTEIGDGAIIGDNVIIGAKCFIPAGVVLCNNAWIGPCVTFTNDTFPPSPDKKYWKGILVESFASIGAGSIIIPGTIIGHGSLIGAGSIVTKNVPPYEVWAGNPARKLRERRLVIQ